MIPDHMHGPDCDFAVAACNRCEYTEAWSTMEAAEAAAVWHVFEMHPKTWLQIVGARPPRNPRPIEMGSLL